jgi:hypothetical protein
LKDTNLTDHDIATGRQTHHSSLTVFSKEFTVFLGYHNKELMADLCDWYDCDSRWVYETIARKREEIVGVWLNLVAATTPDLIQSALPIESIGGGLTSRIIFIYEEKKSKLVTLPIQSQAESELYTMLIHDLEKISMLSGQFTFTSGFAERWDTWCREADENPPFLDKKFDGYNGRRRTHLMKLSMISAVAHGRNGLILTADDLDEAINILIEAEIKMGLVFRGVGKSDISEMIYKVTNFFVTSYVDEIPYWQFARHFCTDMDKLMMDRVLHTLEATKVIKTINRPGTDALIKVLERPDGSKFE